jgi:hypothetical protein
MQDKRSRPRLKVSMPVQVVGRTVDGEKFKEVCQTQDASAFGLCLVLESIVERGTTLFLSMQMPSRLRLYDLSQPTYHIYAQVRRVHILAEGGCEVGLSFIGKNPPPNTENLQTIEFLNIDTKTGKNPFAKTKFPTGAYQQSTPSPNKTTQSNPVANLSQNQNRVTQSNPVTHLSQNQNRVTQSNPATNPSQNQNRVTQSNSTITNIGKSASQTQQDSTIHESNKPLWDRISRFSQ